MCVCVSFWINKVVFLFYRDKNVFMKRFKVGYSSNGSDWTMVNEDNDAKPRVREAAREFMFWNSPPPTETH